MPTSPKMEKVRDIPLSNFTAYSEPSKLPKVNIENAVGFLPVPVGLAGPLRVYDDAKASDEYFAPLATVEPTVVASCSRGCKALQRCGGVRFHVIEECMSRAPMFSFPSLDAAIRFAAYVPHLQDQLAMDAESTSRHISLRGLTPHVIGSKVHVKFDYTCGDAAGQNMVTFATQHACDCLLRTDAAKELEVTGFAIEGDMASDKKASWGNVVSPRGVRVVAFAELTNNSCEEVLSCTTEYLFDMWLAVREAQVRNGQFGSNVNAANIVAAMFIACGQDAGSVAEASWSQLTLEYKKEDKRLHLSLYFPSLPVGTVGGGTSYPAQRSSLKLLKCDGAGSKGKLAGLIAAFALALEVSTAAAITSNTFTESHKRLARRQEVISSSR